MRLTKNPFKKLLYAYAVATVLVIVYFIARLIFQEEKTIEYKSFENIPVETITEPLKETEEEKKTRFLLLPTK